MEHYQSLVVSTLLIYVPEGACGLVRWWRLVCGVWYGDGQRALCVGARSTTAHREECIIAML